MSFGLMSHSVNVVWVNVVWVNVLWLNVAFSYMSFTLLSSRLMSFGILSVYLAFASVFILLFCFKVPEKEPGIGSSLKWGSTYSYTLKLSGAFQTGVRAG